MKILLLALIFLTACSKEKKPKGKYCFYCIFTRSAAGWQKPPLDTCCDDNPRGDFQWHDPYNNDINSYCTPK